ncbi:MAG: hypothetical protein ACJ762_01645 [Solirubrobacteraceae bacterium]
MLRAAGGAIAGVCSVYAAEVPLVGGRRFWIFRSLLPGAAAEHWPDLVSATFAHLDAEFDGAPDAPVGLCALADATERRRRPQAEWAEPPRMIHAGFLDGRAVRIAYFADASIAGQQSSVPTTWPPLTDGYRIEPFAEQDTITGQDIIDLWTSEQVLALAEAQRRVGEVLLVASDAQRRPVGVSTAYLEHNAQLGCDLWYYRAFVAHSHRKSAVAVWLAMHGRDLLRERFAGGTDTRAPGMIFEVENEGLKAYFHQARWRPTEFLFVGVNDLGAHVRVHWFPGAIAPEPPHGST